MSMSKSAAKLLKAAVVAEATASRGNATQQPKQKQGAGKKKSKSPKAPAGRVHRSQLKEHPVFGSDNFVSNVDHLPAAFVNFEGNTTWLSKPGSVRNPKLGIDGICLHGCQPLADITTTGTDSQLFVSGVATVASINAIALSPDTLNGPLAAQANLHQKYVFRDIIIEYISNVATSQAGSAAMSILTDAGGGGAPTTFSLTRQTIPSMTFPFRTDRAYLHYHYDGMDTWFTEFTSATTADARLTGQAQLYGFPSTTSIGAISQGFTNIWFGIELYQPTNSQGFTLALKSDDEYKIVRQFVDNLRKSQKIASEEDAPRGTQTPGVWVTPSLTPAMPTLKRQF